MVGETNEERRRIKNDFSLAIAELWHGQGFRESHPVYAELHEAGKELEADMEKSFLFEWNIVDIDESHIYVTNKFNGHRYHVSVIYPAALYVDVFRIEDDGTEKKHSHRLILIFIKKNIIKYPIRH